MESYGVHLKGMHHMVEVRGGLDNLGIGGILKASILQRVNSLPANTHALTAGRSINYWTLMTGTLSKYSSIKPVAKLEYPKHPFNSHLCASIATMPKGFRDLAFEAMLSIRMINILERMSKFVTHV